MSITSNALFGHAMQDFTDQFSGINLPLGWTLKEKTDPLFTTPDPDSGEISACTLSPAGNNYFGMPFYNYQLTQKVSWIKDKCLRPSQPDHFTTFWLKISGIRLTALAAAQGAPFWFDILKKLIDVRGAGTNRAEKDGK